MIHLSSGVRKNAQVCDLRGQAYAYVRSVAPSDSQQNHEACADFACHAVLDGNAGFGYTLNDGPQTFLPCDDFSLKYFS
jgi:hypothetical protein